MPALICSPYMGSVMPYDWYKNTPCSSALVYGTFAWTHLEQVIACHARLTWNTRGNDD